MAVDPETGIITPDVTRQPLGPMGAILGLSNAQRATEIADTLQRQRQAQLAASQSQEEQRQADITRETQMREALGKLYAAGHQPTMEELQSVVLPYAKSPESLLPWFRGATAAKGRVDAAKINAMAAIGKQRINSGESPQSVLGSMSSMLATPEEQEAFKNSLTNVPSTPLPVPQSTSILRKSLANKADTQSQVLLDREPAEIALDQARAEAARARAAYEGYRARGGTGKVSGSTVTQLSNALQRAIKARDLFVNRPPKADPTTGLPVKVTPEQKAKNDDTLAKMEAEIKSLTADIATARGSAATADTTPPPAPPAKKLSPEEEANQFLGVK